MVPVPSCLRLKRSEVLKNMRHYLRAQSQGHHAIDRLEERGAERGSARPIGQQPKSPGVNRSRARQKLPTGQQTKTKGVDRSRERQKLPTGQQTKTKGWIGQGQDKNYQRGRDENENNGATDEDDRGE